MYSFCGTHFLVTVLICEERGLTLLSLDTKGCWSLILTVRSRLSSPSPLGLILSLRSLLGICKLVLGMFCQSNLGPVLVEYVCLVSRPVRFGLVVEFAC